ncbi:MAG: hypothetical protein HFF69_08150, partial [Oscillospiraceae bacterium]|nr:hypothetical protein [Oscillospiraceae bacterium]
LTVDGVDVTGQIVDGVYTCTLTITGNNEITIVGSSGKIEGIPVDYQGVPVDGGVAVVPESNTLTVGTDIPDPNDASLAEMVEGKLGVWVYVNEMAEENEIKAVDGVYTIPETATKVIVFYGNDTTEAPDEPTNPDNPDNPDTPDNPDDWTPVEPLSAAATIAGRAAGIQTLDLPTATFTFWYFVPSTQDITTATVFNNGVTTSAGEPKVATEAEIAAVCERNASIKSNLDEKWAADPNGKVGYVTFTYVTGDHTVTPDVRTKAVAPVETDDTIQAIIDNGTYKFYRYASEAALTDDQVKAALTNALNELWSTKSVSSIALDHSKGKATVTWSDGTESKIDYNKEGNAKIGSYLHPELLYKVTYEGTVLGYKKADSSNAVTFDVAGVKKGDYAIREGEMIANSTTGTADAGKKFVTAKDGQLDIKVERPAEGYDVNYAKAVAFTVDIGNTATTLAGSSTVASTDAKFPTDGTSGALTIAANNVVVCEKNVYLRFTEGAAGSTGKKYTLTVNGTAVDSTAKIGDGTNTLTFDVLASTLTPDKAGEIKIGLKESNVVDGVKVRIGQLDGTVAEAVDAVVGSDDKLYAVMSEELAGADVKWGIVSWTGVTPTFVLTTAPTDTPAYESAVDGIALDITSADKDPDGCVWILPFVQVKMAANVAEGSISNSNRTVSFEGYTGEGAATNFVTGVYVPVGATMELMSDTTNTRLSATIGGKTEGIGTVGTDGSAAKATLKVTKAVTVTEDEVLRKLTIALNNDTTNVGAGDEIGDIEQVWKLAGTNELLTHVDITFVDENGYELNDTTVTVGESEFGIQINFAKAVFAGYVVDGSVSVDIKGYKGGLVTFGTGTLEENPDGSWTINAWLDGSKLA